MHPGLLTVEIIHFMPSCRPSPDMAEQPWICGLRGGVLGDGSVGWGAYPSEKEATRCSHLPRTVLDRVKIESDSDVRRGDG